jgi:hypothetical protein
MEPLEPIHPYSWITFAVILIFALIIVVIASYGIAKLKAKRKLKKEKEDQQEFEYGIEYLTIEKHIRKWEVNRTSFLTIRKEIYNLGQMPFKNHEYTSTLTANFYLGRFIEEARKDIDEKRLVDKNFKS